MTMKWTFLFGHHILGWISLPPSPLEVCEGRDAEFNWVYDENYVTDLAGVLIFEKRNGSTIEVIKWTSSGEPLIPDVKFKVKKLGNAGMVLKQVQKNQSGFYATKVVYYGSPVDLLENEVELKVLPGKVSFQF